MRCSVIILNWNGVDWLRRFLPSVIGHTQVADCEIVVADNGSTDDSVQMLRQSFPEVRLMLFDRNYGFAEGYNKAIEAVDAEYVVLLNSDVEVTDHWLTTLLDFADAHPDAAAFQPKVLSWKSKEAGDRQVIFEHAGAAGGYIDVLGYPFCRGRLLSHVEADHGQYDNPVPIFWATGACMLIRTDVYRREGGLDPRYFAHMEEIDLCWRLACRGYELWCVPQSTIYHVGGGALGYENPQKTYLNFRNSLLTLYKNLPLRRLIWLLPCRFLLDMVAAAQMLLSRHPQNSKAVLKARRDYHRLRHTYRQIRRQNLKLAIHDIPKTIANRSIIFDYYILRKKA